MSSQLLVSPDLVVAGETCLFIGIYQQPLVRSYPKLTIWLRGPGKSVQKGRQPQQLDGGITAVTGRILTKFET